MFTCDVRFPDRTETVEQVASATLPTETGEVEVLDGHAEAFFLLSPGSIVLDTNGRSQHFEVEEGCVYVDPKMKVTCILTAGTGSV